MAEKRVSVRLAAVGGRQVRAELEGVGEAGSRGFGRLSREMEAANAQNKDACGEKVGFFCKHGGTVAIEVVAFGRNQCGERADLRNQGLADKA